MIIVLTYMSAHKHKQRKGGKTRRALRQEGSLRFAHQTGWLKLSAVGFTFQ